ncbi:hypothetical protein, partial [Clostridium perfringens]|uniref:hypothetical protein n=1 Tax=Clostridium perfringens TaxID=1502 RepID=UPI0013E4089A
MKDENINIKYQNKVNLIFIILVTISFLLYRFVFDRNGNLLSLNYILIYFVVLVLVISSLINYIKYSVNNSKLDEIEKAIG